ncbi:MAG: hypothetical protein ACI4U3_08540 [Traorella sp.]
MEKLTLEQYITIINEKKQEAHNKQWLYIEINAKELMEECEPNVRNQITCAKAILETLLEGDRILTTPKNKSKLGGALTVRYYVDNLSSERGKYTQEPKF